MRMTRIAMTFIGCPTKSNIFVWIYIATTFQRLSTDKTMIVTFVVLIILATNVINEKHLIFAAGHTSIRHNCYFWLVYTVTGRKIKLELYSMRTLCILD